MTVRGNQPRFYLVPIQHHTDVEARTRQINHRLDRLEKGTSHLKASQKWPTQKSMSLHLYQQLSTVPEIVIHPPTPEQRHCWSHHNTLQHHTARPSNQALDILLSPSPTPKTPFPIPITTGPTTPRGEISFLDSSFIYFSFLPTELRLQIWELELRRPKFVEARFSSQFYAPTFVGACTAGSPLLGACRESREVVLALDGLFGYLTPVQRDFGKMWSRTPVIAEPSVAERSLPFIPENDTVFFRSLDRPQGGLQSMACGVSGFENIQHLALPLPPKGLPLKNDWKVCLGLFRDLKTLTFLVGGKDQSWRGGEEIELRDLEEWYSDGRDRSVKVDGWLLDVAEVGRFLGGACFEKRMRGSWDSEWPGLNVRVVAWTKES